LKSARTILSKTAELLMNIFCCLIKKLPESLCRHGTAANLTRIQDSCHTSQELLHKCLLFLVGLLHCQSCRRASVCTRHQSRAVSMWRHHRWLHREPNKDNLQLAAVARHQWRAVSMQQYHW
jgi:hypothetical protein